MLRAITHVATLISNPGAPAVDPLTISRVSSALPDAAEPRWLEPGIAADVYFTLSSSGGEKALADRLRAALPGPEARVDVVVQGRAYRRKRLLVANMDSTMIAQECIDELADALGVRGRVSAITDRAMRGEIAFETALRERPWRSSKVCRLLATSSITHPSKSRGARARDHDAGERGLYVPGFGWLYPIYRARGRLAGVRQAPRQSPDHSGWQGYGAC